MKVFKRNAVILTVLMFVCVAAYLNWSYNRGLEQEALADTTPAVGGSEVTEAINPADGEDGEENPGMFYQGDTEPGDETLSEVSDFFSTARLNRQQARDSAMNILREAAETETASQEVIDTALGEITVMATYAITEAQIENILKAKGFEDCVVFISADYVNVTVPAPAEGLSEAAIARITDAAVSESGVEVGQIKIIEVK